MKRLLAGAVAALLSFSMASSQVVALEVPELLILASRQHEDVLRAQDTVTDLEDALHRLAQGQYPQIRLDHEVTSDPETWVFAQEGKISVSVDSLAGWSASANGIVRQQDADWSWQFQGASASIPLWGVPPTQNAQRYFANEQDLLFQEAQLGWVRNMAQLQILDALFGLERTAASVEIAREQRARLDVEHVQSQVLFSIGSIDALTLSQSENRLRRAELSLDQLERRLHNQRLSLLDSLGLADYQGDLPSVLDLPGPAHAEDLSLNWTDLYDNSLAVSQARKSLEQAVYDDRVERLQDLPSVSVYTGYNGAHDQWEVALRASYQFSLGQSASQDRTEKAVSNLERAEAELDHWFENQQEELWDLWIVWEIADVDAAMKNIELEKARTQYEQGFLDVYAYQDAVWDAHDAQWAKEEALHDLRMHWLELHVVMGADVGELLGVRVP